MPRTPFRCPRCGFIVYNRRIANCESCAAELPADFALNERTIGHLDADHVRNERARAELAREAAETERKRTARRGDGGDVGWVGDVLDGLSGDD